MEKAVPIVALYVHNDSYNNIRDAFFPLRWTLAQQIVEAILLR